MKIAQEVGRTTLSQKRQGRFNFKLGGFPNFSVSHIAPVVKKGKKFDGGKQLPKKQGTSPQNIQYCYLYPIKGGVVEENNKNGPKLKMFQSG